MIRYLLKQMLELVPLLFLVSAAAFFLIRLLPGDPATAYLNSVNVPVTEESLQLVREELGLDDSVQVQYVKWLGQVLQGDLGNSYQTKQPVIQELKTDLKYTGILALAALVWVLVLSAFFGILAAEKANSFWDRLIRGFTFLGAAMPKFWLGFLLVLLFSLKWKLFPVQGATSLRCLILPSFTLACSYIATYTKLLRNSILEIKNQPYVAYARVRGFTRKQVIRRHVIPNALLPVCTALGLHIGGILSGAVIVENVFSWPGLGRMCVSAVASRNYPMIQGYILLMAVIFVVTNLISDMACAALNPRIRLGAEK
ncbi:MAG: ABC transporter permease [Lachnospiraceae bacterium]|jgi:nickel transport system permease protein|nr:ABC transporter permease [Lachnospiraceae bacterium]MCI9134648.1 ABC transporter permease [Lachnospiraceae bacterium]